MKLRFVLVPVPLLACALMTSVSCRKPDAFVGEWKLDPSKSKLVDEMKVEKVEVNKYTFDFGGGSPETIAVDGTDQPGGSDTTLSVTAEGPDRWKVVRKKKDGHILLTASWALSQDGKTLRDEFTSFDPSGAPSTVHYVYERTAPGSGFAADWVGTSDTVPASITLRVRAYEGDGLSIENESAHRTKNMKPDGKDYPIAGPDVAPGTTSSLRRVDERTLELTDKLGGKALDTQQLALSSDGRTMTMTMRQAGRDAPSTLVFERL